MHVISTEKVQKGAKNSSRYIKSLEARWLVVWCRILKDETKNNNKIDGQLLWFVSGNFR